MFEFAGVITLIEVLDVGHVLSLEILAKRKHRGLLRQAGIGACCNVPDCFLKLAVKSTVQEISHKNREI